MSEIFYAGMIPFYLDGCDVGTMIYHIDAETSIGDIVPNLGTAPNADMSVFSAGATTVVVQGTIGAVPVCDPSLPWTILIRVGDFASAYAGVSGPTESVSISGAFVAVGGAQPNLFEHGQATTGLSGLDILHVLYGLAQASTTNTTPESDIVFMVSANPPAVGAMTSDYRVVSIQGGVVTDIPASPVLYSPGSSIVGSIVHTNVSFSEGITGLALWREYITTDAEFLAKLAEFEAA